MVLLQESCTVIKPKTDPQEHLPIKKLFMYIRAIEFLDMFRYS